jgi:hypothetical protein
MVVRSAVVVFGLVEAHALPSAAEAVPYFCERQAGQQRPVWLGCREVARCKARQVHCRLA